MVFFSFLFFSSVTFPHLPQHWFMLVLSSSLPVGSLHLLQHWYPLQPMPHASEILKQLEEVLLLALCRSHQGLPALRQGSHSQVSP